MGELKWPQTEKTNSIFEIRGIWSFLNYIGRVLILQNWWLLFYLLSTVNLTMCYCNYKPRQTCMHSRQSIILTEKRRNTLLCINDFIKQISQDFGSGTEMVGKNYLLQTSGSRAQLALYLSLALSVLWDILEYIREALIKLNHLGN